jgi:protein-arginine kinase activator protein McsA
MEERKMKKDKCIDCGRGFKKLTKEGRCAGCYQEKHKKWSDEFIDSSDKAGK